jgi:hypothetical protein
MTWKHEVFQLDPDAMQATMHELWQDGKMVPKAIA